MNPEIVGCFSARVRNKNLSGFVTDYDEPVKRPSQLGVLYLG